MVAELVARGHAVRGLDSRPLRVAVVGATHRTVDLRDADAVRPALEGCAGVVHLAGHPRAGTLAPTEVFTTNTALTFHVTQAALDLGMPLLTNASSVSALGYPFFTQPLVPAYLPVDEGATTTPEDAYGLSKAVGEQIITAAVEQSGGALAAVSLRMPWLQSPRTFVQDISAGGGGMAARNLFAYLDTRDAAAALASVFERDHRGHTRLLAAEDTFSSRPTSELVVEHLPGVKLHRPIEGHTSLLDSSAAQRHLGWAPRWSWRAYAVARP